MQNVLRNIGVFILLATLVACSKEGDTIYLPDPAERQASTAPLVIVIHSIEGVGDQSYNDLIYSGVEEAALKHGLRTLQLVPSTQKEAQTYLESLFQEMSTVNDTVRRLCIVASSDYDDFVRKNNKRLEGNDRASLLYLESSQPLEGKGSTLYLPYYGAMYEAGHIAPFFSPTITLIGANPQDQSVTKAIEGFTAGCQDQHDDDYSCALNTLYLGQTAGTGYAIDDEKALELLRDNDILYSFSSLIVPVCGGAMKTFARLADIADTYSFMGVDVSWPSVNCHFSVVKHIDTAVAQCIEQWLSAEGMPKHQSLGLASGYTEVLLHAQSADLRETIDEHLSYEVMATIHQQAIRKEAEHDK